VLELHRQHIFEQIAPPGLLKPQPRAGRNEPTVDVRPGVVDEACAQTGDQRAQIKLHEGQHDQHRAGQLEPRRRR